MGVVLGIDYGVKHTKVSYVNENGKPCDVTFFDGLPYMASAVCADEDGSGVIVGNEALAEGALWPEALMRHSKNHLGYDTIFEVAGKGFTAGDILFLVLQKAIKETEASLNGVPIDGAYLSCPAYFASCSRDDIKKTAERVVLSNGEHLKVKGLVDDPIATVLEYCNLLLPKSDGRIKKKLLIYDLGGAFDVTAVSVDFDGTDKRVEILGTYGIHDFGTDNWKYAVADIITRKFAHLTDTDPDDLRYDNEFKMWVENIAERALKALARREQVEVTVMYNGENERVKLTGDEICEETIDLLDTTVSYVDCVLNECGFTYEDIDGLLICGGGAMLPGVKSYLDAYYGRKNVICKSLNTVARGAALMGVGNAPDSKRRHFKDGIEIGEGESTIGVFSGMTVVGMMAPTFLWDYYVTVGDAEEYHLLFKKGDELPNSGEIIVRTEKDDQTKLVVRVFEVIGALCDADCEKLEPYEIPTLDLMPGLPKGAELRITLKVTLYKEMELSVEDIARKTMVTVMLKHKSECCAEELDEICKLTLE